MQNRDKGRVSVSNNQDRQNFNSGLLTVLAVVLAGVIQVSSTTGPFTPWNVIIGIVLILALSTYSTSRHAPKRERLALASTWGFLIISGAGWGFQEFYRWANNTWWAGLPDFQSNGDAPDEYYLILWLITSSIAWFVISKR
jgi:hypothetical protein